MSINLFNSFLRFGGLTPSTDISEYTSPTSATASSQKTISDVEFVIGDTQSYSGAVTQLNLDLDRLATAETIANVSDLVGLTVTGVKMSMGRHNNANGNIIIGFSTRSSFCGSGTIDTTMGTKACSTITASGWGTYTFDDTSYTIPECSMLIAKTTNNQSGTYIKFKYDEQSDYTGSAFSANGKGGTSNDSIPNDATCNVTCTTNYTRSLICSLLYDQVQSASNAVDDDTATYWESNSEGTPSITVDMGSIDSVADIAIFLKSDTTTSVLGIEISEDDSSYTEMTEVNVSALTDGAWNFIALSAGINARYLKIKSKDGSDSVLAINEIKVREV